MTTNKISGLVGKLGAQGAAAKAESSPVASGKDDAKVTSKAQPEPEPAEPDVPEVILHLLIL
jgi:hypothetical protein